jgi:hypothetical protein
MGRTQTPYPHACPRMLFFDSLSQELIHALAYKAEKLDYPIVVPVLKEFCIIHSVPETFLLPPFLFSNVPPFILGSLLYFGSPIALKLNLL